MATARCPNCKSSITNLPYDYQDTVQCDNCAEIVRIVIRDNRPVDVRLRKLDLDIPAGLPKVLEQILSEAISCFEIGSNAATVVLAGLFTEGLLAKAGMEGERLVEMIEKAHQEKAISTLGYHVATTSRLLRNIGAHYSDDLTKLTSSDARLVLEMARKLAADIVSSGKLKSD